MTIRSALTTTLAALALVASATATMSSADAAGTADKATRCFGKLATIVGTAGDDVLKGTKGNDVVVAGAGDDRVNGRGGNDLVCGGKGGDRLVGGGGADSLDGEAGNDSLSAGGGADYCAGGGGTDLCHGGSPGPVEPTPGDPDNCAKDVEAKISCRGPGDESGVDGGGSGGTGGPGEDPGSTWPDRWVLTMSGTNTYRPAPSYVEVTTWSVEVTLEESNEFQGTVDYVSLPGTVSGSYETHGGSGRCVIAAWGSMSDGDLSGSAALHPDGTYSLDWEGLHAVPSLWTCPEGDLSKVATVNAGEQLTAQVWDPVTLGGVSGQRTVALPNDVTQDYSWSMVPAS